MRKERCSRDLVNYSLGLTRRSPEGSARFRYELGMGKEQEHSIHEFIWEEKEADEDFRR